MFIATDIVFPPKRVIPANDTMITNYSEFWDFYVQEHSKPATRLLHFAGTSLGFILLVWFIWRGTWYYFPLSLVVGYAFAWFAHFVVEKNKPATFKYPLWSFISDYKMMWYMMTGRMNREVERVLGKNFNAATQRRGGEEKA